MMSDFPIEDLARPRRRERGCFRLRYLLLPLVLMGLFFFFLPNGNSGSEVILPKGKTLTGDELVHIDEDLIRRHHLTVEPDLQRFIAETAQRYKLYYGTMVVMDARTGDILAMYGKGLGGEDCTLCLKANHSASVFKMVTAVAALEHGFAPGSVFSYSGGAHTLYRNQITGRRDRWTADITLADAFAQSNNVVFGKLGAFYLGEPSILLAAMKMGFWRSPLPEVDCEPSTLFFPGDGYELAELTSGFNRKTRITPVHAAQMAALAANGGGLVTPRIVRGRDVQVEPAVDPSVAERLSMLMQRTVRCGTLSQEFRHASSDRVLRDLTIGAKSGSIDGDDPPGRRNWFVGFARENPTGEAIAIGCLLVLNERFWIQADTFSRLVIRHYFSQRREEAASQG
jgi:cell division protein FtsI/penicillin-binding protein 2